MAVPWLLKLRVAFSALGYDLSTNSVLFQADVSCNMAQGENIGTLWPCLLDMGRFPEGFFFYFKKSQNRMTDIKLLNSIMLLLSKFLVNVTYKVHQLNINLFARLLTKDVCYSCARIIYIYIYIVGSRN